MARARLFGALSAAAAAHAAPTRRRRACSAEVQATPRSPPQPPPQPEGLGLNSQHLSIFARNGSRVSFGEVLQAAERADVILVGEVHDDPVAHQVELYLLASLHQRRSCGLSLEMFETDVQSVLDEYLAGQVQERDFLLDARPWANYEDYRALVEFAKYSGIPVTAANAPRRYVGAVGRDGLGALSARHWPASSANFLPPLPLPEPSPAYMQHLERSPAVPLRRADLGIACGSSLGSSAFMCRPSELAPCVILWDSAMAFSISRQLASDPTRAMLHVCGVFHAERFVGICEMLSHYRRGTRPLVVAIYPEDDCHTFVEDVHASAADFVILTDATLPRTHDYFAFSAGKKCSSR